VTRRTTRITIRLTPQEHETWKKAAGRLVPIGTWARDTINHHLTKKPKGQA